MDDATAIRRLKEGDIGGLEALIMRYQVEAVRTALLITHDADLADDVMQEAFLRVYRSIDRFDEHRPFAPWLMRIVVNAALQSVQRESRHVSLNGAETGEDFLPDSAISPESMVEDAERQQAVWKALQALSPEQRAVIVLRYYLDYSEREMADALQTPPGTIGWRLYAARKRLGGLLHRFGKPIEAREE